MDTIPHQSLLISLFSLQLLFGTLYAIFIHEIAVRHWLTGNTALWVVVGVLGTLGIQLPFFPESWEPWTVFASFACSGLPMVLSYWYRHQVGLEKKKVSHPKKARPWPTFASQMRDDAVIQLSGLTVEIEEKIKSNDFNAGFVVGLLNALHGIIKVLKSV